MGFLDLFSPASDVHHVNADELQNLLRTERPILLDVREPFEHERRHIDGSILIPLGQLERRMTELSAYKDKLIAVYCASGSRSTMACRFLQTRGFNVVNLTGGISRWR